MIHYLHINDPMVKGGRVEPSIDGDQQATCITCSNVFSHANPPHDVIEGVCGRKCLTEDFGPYSPKFVSKPKEEAKPPCPDCAGPARKNGFAHKEDCPRKKPIALLKPPCAKCGGPARGRGFTHAKDCPVVIERQATPKTITRPSCPTCGGPACGRGFSHSEGCSARPATAYEPSKRKCPKCGGSARGRGFIHTKDCSK